MNLVTGGGQVGWIITLSDGTPINVSQIGDPLQIGTPNVSDATGISPIPADPSPSRFWNAAAFNATSPELLYRFGNTGRNLLTMRGLIHWDFSLTKETVIGERHRLELRYKAFDFANHFVA